MTPVSHSFFGFTAGFALCPLTDKLGISRKRTVILSTLGSVMPDIDAISLVLNRKIYFGLKWYSHHGLSHSFSGALVIAIAFIMIFQPGLTLQALKDKASRKTWIVSLFVFFTGSLIHLPCDMVTLPGPWKGIPLLAPFSWQRFGGWTHIPWKDYYLIYISIATYIVFIPVFMLEYFLKKKTALLPLISIFILSWAVYHTYNSRFINYSQWEKEQKQLVGKELYQFANNLEMKISRLWHINTLL